MILKQITTIGKYIDVCSLYPTVLYYDPFPIGHPYKICKLTKYNSEWFGFIYCNVIPLQGLYIHILPYKQEIKTGDTKLLFGLCRSCMEVTEQKCNHYTLTKCLASDKKVMRQNCEICYELRNSPCIHVNSQRAITGFLTTIEMDKALEKVNN